MASSSTASLASLLEKSVSGSAAAHEELLACLRPYLEALVRRRVIRGIGADTPALVARAVERMRTRLRDLQNTGVAPLLREAGLAVGEALEAHPEWSRPVEQSRPCAAADRDEVAVRVAAALARLPDRYRLALELYFCEALADDAISAALRIPPALGSVCRLRALQRLRDELARGPVPDERLVDSTLTSEAPATATETMAARELDVELPAMTGPLADAVVAMRAFSASVCEFAGLPDPFPGEYRFVRILGRGGYGVVWLADDLNLGRSVALKTLRIADPVRLAALRQEAKILAGLAHPNIVRVFAWRQSSDGEQYLVMQYVAGSSLRDRLLESGPLAWQAAVRYAADVGDALSMLHAASLIHRDVKPANILWASSTDEAVLTDFGLTSRLGVPEPAAGTPPYMAPEAFAGTIGPAGDVYGLAATVYALVAGVPPFPALPWSEMPAAIARGLPDPDPRCQGLPEAVERLLREALAADPERRPTMAAFVARLRGALNQLLADGLAPGTLATVRLLVSRWEGSAYVPLTASRPPATTRDLKRVPPVPERVRLQTGDRIRLQVVADQPGYLTVFNVGPTGNLNPLSDGGGQTAAQQPLDVLEVELMPPAGRERVFAVWTRTPWTVSTDAMRDVLSESAGEVSQSYRATRDLQRLQQAVGQLPANDRATVVLELDHQPR